MLKGDHYQERLKESMDELKAQAARVRDEASVRTQVRAAEMDKKADIRDIKADRCCEQGNITSKSRLTTQADYAPKNVFSMKKQKEKMAAIPGATAQVVLNQLLRLVQSGPAYNYRTGGPPQTSGLLSLLNGGEEGLDSSTKSNEGVTVEGLLAALDCDEDVIEEEVKCCLTLGFSENVGIPRPSFMGTQGASNEQLHDRRRRIQIATRPRKRWCYAIHLAALICLHKSIGPGEHV